MGQGNAIAHLMPPPFYAYRYVVAKARAPEESISDQIAKIRDEGPTPYKRYKIEVMPGNYPEVIEMVPYVDVVAPYGKVIIQPATGTFGVKMASNCMLQGVEVNLTTIQTETDSTGIVIEAANDNVIIEDCWVTADGTPDFGITDDSANNINIRRCRIDSVATGYKKTGTGTTTWFYDNRVTATTIDVDVDAGTLTLVECELMGAANNVYVGVADTTAARVDSWGNTLGGTGWAIADNVNAWVYSHNDKFIKVTHDGAGHMVSTEEPQTYRVHNGMKIGDTLTAIAALTEGPLDTRRFTVELFSGEYSEAIAMLQYVDLVGESNESCVIYQPSATVITANNDSRVKNVRVELTGATATAAINCGEGIQGYFEEVVVKVTHTDGVGSACIASSSTGGFEIHDSVLEIDNAADYPITTDGSGTHLVYDSELINTDTTAGYGMDVAAGGATVTVSSFNNKLRSVDGFRIADSANAVCLSYGDDYTTVVFVGAAGEFVDLTGCRLYDCEADLKVREWVFVDPADCHAEEADADSLSTMPAMGVVVWKPGMPAADTGTTCYVKNYGYLYHASGPWTCGEEYWISATAGQITTTMHPVWPQRAGVATSTKRFKILIGDNLGLVHCNEYLCATGVITSPYGQWVYKKNGAAEDDLVALAKADADGTMPAIGVAVAVLVVGGVNDTILVKLRGKYSMATPADGPGPFDPGDDIFIDPGTAGLITSIRPIADIVQKVAEVKSEDGTTLIYEIAD